MIVEQMEKINEFIENRDEHIIHISYDKDEIIGVLITNKDLNNKAISEILFNKMGIYKEDAEKILQLTDKEIQNALTVAKIKYYKQEMDRLSNLLSEE